MKSFTIHKVDAETVATLEELANRENSSVNRLVKRLLREALGLEEPARADHRAEFEDLFATWSPQEARAFDKAVCEFEQVRESDWRD